jgi:molybdenum cofactor guanylyltransferase
MTSPMHTSTAGIVLCGGQSRRMGQPKAWLPFGPETLLQRVVRILSEVVQPIVVVAAPGQDLPELPRDVEIVHDSEAHHGPLAGLLTGLKALEGRAEAAYLSACDVPFLKPEFVRFLASGRFTSAEGNQLDGLTPTARPIIVPRIDGFPHPLAGVYPVGILPIVEELLHSGQRRLRDLFDHVPTRFLDATDLVEVDASLQSLRNINNLEDYGAALADYNSSLSS